jgi:hypothetical protein
MTMVGRVGQAIAGVQLFYRYNDWTSDRVEGFPIEICKDGPGDVVEPIVVKRFAGTDKEGQDRLYEVVRAEQAKAAIEAMREPTEAMKISGELAEMENGDAAVIFRGMITAALKESGEANV